MIENKEYPVPILGTTILLCHFKSGSRRIDTSMEVISKQEYDMIRNRLYNYNSPKYGIVHRDNIQFIGRLNFDNDSIKTYLNTLKLANEDTGFHMYSGFNFETSTITTDENKLKWYYTWDSIKIMKYKYCQIGKPEFVVIFKAPCK